MSVEKHIKAVVLCLLSLAASLLTFVLIFVVFGGLFSQLHSSEALVLEHGLKGTLVVYVLLSLIVYFKNKKLHIFEDNTAVYLFLFGPVVGWYVMKITSNPAWFMFAASGSMAYILFVYALIPLFPKDRIDP